MARGEAGEASRAAPAWAGSPSPRAAIVGIAARSADSGSAPARRDDRRIGGHVHHRRLNPNLQIPPSTTASIRRSKLSSTSAAEVGLTRPDAFALGAASGSPTSARIARATG